MACTDIQAGFGFYFYDNLAHRHFRRYRHHYMHVILICVNLYYLYFVSLPTYPYDKFFEIFAKTGLEYLTPVFGRYYQMVTCIVNTVTVFFYNRFILLSPKTASISIYQLKLVVLKSEEIKKYFCVFVSLGFLNPLSSQIAYQPEN